MKTKKLKNLVKKARGELSWPSLEKTQETGPLRIFSDPMARNHTIYLPAGSQAAGPAPELLFLHELGHALLSERVHPFFSSGFPITGLDKELLPAVSPVLNAASDWFVGQWLMEFCPDVALEELRQEYEATAALMDRGETPGVDKFFAAVLIIAQSIRYLKVSVACEGFLDAAVKAFLAVAPERPSLDKLEALINALLALGAPYRCRRVNSEGLEVLEFYPVNS
jgi:hypothetical protein